MRQSVAYPPEPSTGWHRRYDARRKLSLHATVQLEDIMRTRLHVSVRNLGLGGIAVSLPAELLYPDDEVTVSFADGSRTARRGFPATVMWVSRKKAGIAFDDSDRATLQALWNILLRDRRKRGRGVSTARL